MGNDSIKTISQDLNKKLIETRLKLRAYKEQQLRDNLKLPISHQFVYKEEIKIYTETDRAKFFKQLGGVLGGAAAAYTTGTVDPKLIQGVCDFIATVAGSQQGMTQEKFDYSIDKISGSGIIRTDLFAVGSNIQTEGFSKQRESIFGFILIIGAVKSSQQELTQNENKIIKGMKERTEADKLIADMEAKSEQFAKNNSLVPPQQNNGG